MVKMQFLGGAEKVGPNSLFMRASGRGLVLDYGMDPTKPPEYLTVIPPADALLLTHAHLDHSGSIPFLVSAVDIPVYATPLTAEVVSLLWRDAVKVAKLNKYDIPYTLSDVDFATRAIVGVAPGEELTIKGIKVRVYDAGHIPGAVSYLIEVEGKRILFTGDINTVETMLTQPAEVPECDVLIMESTYAGRDHPVREEVYRELERKIEEVLERGGKAVVPAFAVARTQELMILLSERGFDVWVDGMGKAVTNMYLGYPDYIKNFDRLVRATDRVRPVVRPSDRNKFLRKGEVVVTTGGMLEGGPALYYIGKLREDRNSAILLTGYQVEGTNGRLLMDTGYLVIDGEQVKVDMEVAYYDLSAHAGHSGLVEYVMKADPEKVVLFHGEDREALKREIEEDYEVLTPRSGEVFEV
ncbi:MAG: MBL fold metallo-hydrolase [Thermoplasmata archaeon]|nr:MAG: MBL fold metallo-hydrolase [Thermoplasmata archaeon]